MSCVMAWDFYGMVRVANAPVEVLDALKRTVKSYPFLITANRWWTPQHRQTVFIVSH